MIEATALFDEEEINAVIAFRFDSSGRADGYLVVTNFRAFRLTWDKMEQIPMFEQVQTPQHLHS